MQQDFRAGLYLRYSGLQPTVASEQDVICFRGAAETARSLQLQMHNRWNPELNAALITGSDQVTAYQGSRLADGCLWTKRTELLDTWELGHAAVRTHLGWRRYRKGLYAVWRSAIFISVFPIIQSPAPSAIC